MKTLRTVSLVSLLALAACAEHRVDTFSEWCEQITGVDLEEKYSPFWAVIFSVSFDGNGVRDDYVQFLNNTLLKVVENRADRMAWRDGADLHLQNVSGLMDVEPEVAISDWQAGIARHLNSESEDDSDVCFFGTVASMFDGVTIYSTEFNALGQIIGETVTAISTERVERLGDKRL